MKKLNILFFMFLFTFYSCEKSNIEGPSLNDLYGDLNIDESLEAVGDGADFSVGESIYFTAKFSKQVDWTIRIEGKSSGSIKLITGNSNYINESNSSWTGGSTNLPFFVSEICDVSLSFEMHEETEFLNVFISEPKNYINENTILITDFEGGFNPNFTGYFNAGTTKSLTIGGSGEGEKYLQQDGVVNWDWLIGYIDYFSNFWLDQKPLVNDPSQVYFNIMIKGDSTISQADGIPNSLFKLEFYEDENQDGYYDASSEDRYDYEFDVDWNGWKMISICYNDLERLVPASNNSGNGLREPNKISNLRTLLLANPISGFAKADVDFLIWSVGGPILN